MGQQEYNACIAAGGSPESCQIYLQDEDTGKITGLAQLLNRELFDLTRDGAPVRVRVISLTGREGPGGYNLEDTGTGQRYFAANRILVDALGNAYQISPGGDVNTGNPVQSRLMSQSERNAAVQAGIPLLGVPSSTGSTGSFASTQAAQSQAEAFAAAEAEKNRVFTAEQNEANRLQAERDSKLNLARSLATTAMGEKGRAQERAVEGAGKDIFKRLAFMRGQQVPTGPTPVDIFKQGQMETATQQIPDLPANVSDEALESALAKLQAMGQAPDEPTFGFAHGGEMSPGTGAKAVRVGEEGPETLILRPDGSIEVVPEVASAANGLQIGDVGPGFSSLFARLRESVGVPGRVGESTTRIGGRTVTDPAFHSALGVNPVGFFGRGERRHFVGPQPQGAFGAFSQPLSIFQGLRETPQFRTGTGNVTQAGRELSGQVGTLPNPIKIPPSFWANLLPDEQDSLLWAYELANVPPESFRHLNPGSPGSVTGLSGLVSQGARLGG